MRLRKRSGRGHIRTLRRVGKRKGPVVVRGNSYRCRALTKRSAKEFDHQALTGPRCEVGASQLQRTVAADRTGGGNCEVWQRVPGRLGEGPLLIEAGIIGELLYGKTWRSPVLADCYPERNIENEPARLVHESVPGRVIDVREDRQPQLLIYGGGLLHPGSRRRNEIRLQLNVVSCRLGIDPDYKPRSMVDDLQCRKISWL